MHCSICNARSLNKFYVKCDCWECGLSSLSRENNLASVQLQTRDTKDNFLELHSAEEAGGKGVALGNGELD